MLLKPRASIIYKQFALGVRGFSMATILLNPPVTEMAQRIYIHLGVDGAERFPIFFNSFSSDTKSCVDVLRF